MTTVFRTMSDDQRTVLCALEGRVTIADMAEKLKNQFPRPRVQGLMASLKFRGLVDSRNKNWYRTKAGESIIEKMANGTYGQVTWGPTDDNADH